MIHSNAISCTGMYLYFRNDSFIGHLLFFTMHAWSLVLPWNISFNNVTSLMESLYLGESLLYWSISLASQNNHYHKHPNIAYTDIISWAWFYHNDSINNKVKAHFISIEFMSNMSKDFLYIIRYNVHVTQIVLSDNSFFY